MTKYINRLNARLARQALDESAKEGKNWIVSKKLILETEDGDFELDQGEEVEVGGNEEGDLALKGNQAAVVVISDPEIAAKVADCLVQAPELSDVEFVQRDAMDALDNGEDVDTVVDKMADEEGDADTVETAEVAVDKKESVENKYAKFAENVIHADKFVACESILVDEQSEERFNLRSIKVRGTIVESYNNYNDFAGRVAELKGSIQPGKVEIALTEAGKPMGMYDTEKEYGKIYPEKSFASDEEMNNFNDEPESVLDAAAYNDDDWFSPLNDEDMEYLDGAPTDDQLDDIEMDDYSDDDMLECALKNYEESAKTGSDYMKLVETLSNKKFGMKESAIATVIETFSRDLKENCVKVYDSKYGKFVRCFKESADCNNFIAETGCEKRFTKRFFG